MPLTHFRTPLACSILFVVSGAIALPAAADSNEIRLSSDTHGPTLQVPIVETPRQKLITNSMQSMAGGLAGEDAQQACGCDGYFIGDWVVSTASLDNGPGPGAQGVVISSQFESPDSLLLLVEWTNWNDGHGGNISSDCTSFAFEGNSRWWVRCDAVVRDSMVSCACDGLFSVGQRVISTASLETGPGAGATGTVVGAFIFSDAGNVLVEWDGWFDGHGGNGYGSELCPPTLESGDSRWYVDCTSLVPMISTSEPCLADLDGNGLVDGADLNVLLASWGVCP